MRTLKLYNFIILAVMILTSFSIQAKGDSTVQADIEKYLTIVTAELSKPDAKSNGNYQELIKLQHGLMALKDNEYDLDDTTLRKHLDPKIEKIANLIQSSTEAPKITDYLQTWLNKYDLDFDVSTADGEMNAFDRVLELAQSSSSEKYDDIFNLLNKRGLIKGNPNLAMSEIKNSITDYDIAFREYNMAQFQNRQSTRPGTANNNPPISQHTSGAPPKRTNR